MGGDVRLHPGHLPSRPGADPTKLIEELAKRKKIKMNGVSMGQGQEIIARKLISTAVEEGLWVLLQNTHLGLSYLTEVESFLTKTEDLHEDFRLWITAEPHPQFPIGLLQMSIKLTNEAPVGMRAGLRNSYAWVSQDMLDTVSRYEWRQMLFIMCYMHSVVQERRKFGPIGWNIRYEFNQSDLSACVQFLQNHLMEMDAKKARLPHLAHGDVHDQFHPVRRPHHRRIRRASHGYLRRASTSTRARWRRARDFSRDTSCRTLQDINEFRAAIERLPAQESPEIFGLHPNADLTFRTLAVGELGGDRHLDDAQVGRRRRRANPGGDRWTRSARTCSGRCRRRSSPKSRKMLSVSCPGDPRSRSPCTFDRRSIA